MSCPPPGKVTDKTKQNMEQNTTKIERKRQENRSICALFDRSYILG